MLGSLTFKIGTWEISSQNIWLWRPTRFISSSRSELLWTKVKWSASCSVLSGFLQQYSPWKSLGQNTPRVGSCSLLQGIFPTQGSNPGLLHCRQILYQLSYLGNLRTEKHLKGSCVDSHTPKPSSEAALWKAPKIYVKETHFLILKCCAERQRPVGILSRDRRWWVPPSWSPSALLNLESATYFFFPFWWVLSLCSSRWVPSSMFTLCLLNLVSTILFSSFFSFSLFFLLFSSFFLFLLFFPDGYYLCTTSRPHSS